MKSAIVEEIVTVTMNLASGYTRVILDRTQGTGMADGGITWDIKTEVIPVPLRRLGSRFKVKKQTITPETQDTPAMIREAISDSVLAISALEE